MLFPTNIAMGTWSPEGLARRFTLHWDYLAGSDSLEFKDYGTSYSASTKGLALPDSVLRKFYAGNTLRVLGIQ